MGIVNNILLTGAGATFLLFVIARLVPNDKVKAFGVTLGTAVTRFGAAKLGKEFWRKVEVFLENSSTVFFEGLKEGLDSDDKGEPCLEKPTGKAS